MAAASNFDSLSKELQLLIIECCDMPTLYQLCLTNKATYAMAWPVLWQTIDFVNAGEEQKDLAEWQRRFFVSCLLLRDEHRERFDLLAARVETLQLSRLPGPDIPRESQLDAQNDAEFFIGGGEKIFHVIVHFLQLRNLSMFLKNDWDGPQEGETQALKDGLTNLKTLRLGGQIDPGYLQALLHRPETIEELSLINLVTQAGQDEGPDPLLFLRPIQHRFTNLSTLHLSKLGDLDLRDEYDAEPERQSLEEWIGLLKAVSTTLTRLTLELSLVGYRRDENNEGKHSEQQCKEILLPVLLEGDWPRLEQLTLTGLDILKPLDSMPDRITIEYLPERSVEFQYDATPLTVSPPNEIFVES